MTKAASLIAQDKIIGRCCLTVCQNKGEMVRCPTDYLTVTLRLALFHRTHHEPFILLTQQKSSLFEEGETIVL